MIGRRGTVNGKPNEMFKFYVSFWIFSMTNQSVGFSSRSIHSADLTTELAEFSSSKPGNQAGGLSWTSHASTTMPPFSSKIFNFEKHFKKNAVFFVQSQP